MERARIAINPTQRALVGGPLMPKSSREMPEGLLDASPYGVRTQQWRQPFHYEQKKGPGTTSRAGLPGQLSKSSHAKRLPRPRDTHSQRRHWDEYPAEAGREASHAGPAILHPRRLPEDRSGS